MSDVNKQALPEGRYGSRSSNGGMPRWARVTVLAAGIGGGTVLAVVLYILFGVQPIEGKQVSYSVLGDGAVQVDIEVTRDTPQRPAMCIVRARSKEGDEVGRKEVYVAPGSATVTLTTVLRTSKRPVTGEVDVCSYQVPAYLSNPDSGTRPSG